MVLDWDKLCSDDEWRDLCITSQRSTMVVRCFPIIRVKVDRQRLWVRVPSLVLLFFRPCVTTWIYYSTLV